MKTSFRNQKLIFALLLLWLFTSLSGMHGHYCFDGMEPPVSVHFDTVSGHVEHTNIAGHVDFDNKSSQVIAAKIFNIDLPFLIAALVLVIIWPIIGGQCYFISRTPLSWPTITALRPPLRAPPVYSH